LQLILFEEKEQRFSKEIVFGLFLIGKIILGEHKKTMTEVIFLLKALD